MPPTESLNATGQFFELQLQVAWKHLKDGEFDEANGMSRHLLLEPAMSDFHRAGFHTILAHSPDQPYEHAREAYRLYRDMFTNYNPSPEERRVQQTYLDSARRVLRRTIIEQLATPNEFDEGQLQEDLDNVVEQEAEAEAAEEAAVNAAVEAGVIGNEDELEVFTVESGSNGSLVVKKVEASTGTGDIDMPVVEGLAGHGEQRPETPVEASDDGFASPRLLGPEHHLEQPLTLPSPPPSSDPH